MEENIFVVLVCNLLEQQKNCNVMLKIALKLMVSKLIKTLRKSEYIKFKNCGRNIKSPFMIDADFESILVPEDKNYVACSYGLN